MTRIENLLAKGIFPSQIPPCFHTTMLADRAYAITRQFNKLTLTARKCINTRPETFSVARISHSRRLTSIVNPVTQFYLCHAIAKNWKRLEKHYSRSSLSLSKPALNGESTRAISFTPIRKLHEIRMLESAGYKYILISDISQFFPTIYTHTIDWALRGKEKSKESQYKSLKNLGNDLDKLVRYCQSNQTIGLPIGPDSSHIIAEIIGVGIDLEFTTRLGGVPSGFRFVDDYYLCFESQESAERALAKLTSSMAQFELKINSLKTKIIKIEDISDETWKYPLQQFPFQDKQIKQKNDINHYFDLAFNLANKHSDENVMVYAIKKLKGVIIKRQNWSLFESYLCRTAISFPNTLQEIAHIFITYEKYNYIKDRVRIERTLNQIIKDHAPLEHHSEVAWALWLSGELNTKVNMAACELLNEINSSVCLILAHDLGNAGLLEVNFDSKKHSKSINSQNLWGTNWLFAYEFGLRGWLGSNNNFIKKDPFFNVLDKYNISFYDKSRKLEPIFRPLDNFSEYDIEQMFSSDDDVENAFEFYEEEGEYSDMPTTTESLFDEYEIENFEDDVELPF